MLITCEHNDNGCKDKELHYPDILVQYITAKTHPREYLTLCL